MNEFQAGVQYDDLKGSVAADNVIEKRFLDYLTTNKIAEDGELIAGYRVNFGGNDGQEIEEPRIVAYLFEAESFEERPASVRAVEVPISTAKFFSFFKRFDLVMTKKGMNLDGVPVEGATED